MRKRAMVIFAAVFMFVLVQAIPALAVSNISNTFTANDYTPSTNQTIYFSAKTTYGWIVIPNPYSSNFVTEINATQFNKPVNTSYNVPASVNWGYYNPGIFVSPAYRFYSGWWMITPTVNAYLNFSAVAKNTAYGSQYRHRHGQSTELNWDISYGSPAWVTTTKN
ncbi:MAG TPA: hypothetical protein VGK02_04315 [Candidatus Aquicultor sp.]|jgi:hypothetical protein